MEIKKRKQHYSKYKNHSLYGLNVFREDEFNIQCKTNRCFEDRYDSLISSLNSNNKNLLNRLLNEIKKKPIVPDDKIRYQLRQFLPTRK